MLKPIKDIRFLKQLLGGELIDSQSVARFPLLILIENPTAEQIPEKEELFLTKILSAIQLDIDAIKIVNVAYSYDYQTLKEIPAKRIICFGIVRKLPQFPIYEPKYMWQNKEQYEFLFADSLKIIMENSELKKDLWNPLKQRYLG